MTNYTCISAKISILFSSLILVLNFGFAASTRVYSSICPITFQSHALLGWEKSSLGPLETVAPIPRPSGRCKLTLVIRVVLIGWSKNTQSPNWLATSSRGNKVLFSAPVASDEPTFSSWNELKRFFVFINTTGQTGLSALTWMAIEKVVVKNWNLRIICSTWTHFREIGLEGGTNPKFWWVKYVLSF